MNLRILALKFRYAQGRADAAEVESMLQGRPLDVDRIETNGPYVEVHFKRAVPDDSPELDKFVALMGKYQYKLGVNNES
jgi:hypothetical protein